MSFDAVLHADMKAMQDKIKVHTAFYNGDQLVAARFENGWTYTRSNGGVSSNELQAIEKKYGSDRAEWNNRAASYIENALKEMYGSTLRSVRATDGLNMTHGDVDKIHNRGGR